MDEGKKIFLITTTFFILALVAIFLVYDTIITQTSSVSKIPVAPSSSIDIFTVIEQLLIIIGSSSIVLIAAIKWKEKKIKQGKNCDFNKLIRTKKRV